MRRNVDLRTYPDWIHAELINWSRWCWLGAWPHPLPPEYCGSIERNYPGHRLPEGNADDEARPIQPNETNARIVDRVWKALPDLPRLVLRAEYPQRYESGRVEHGRAGAARWLHVSLRDYEAGLIVAIGRIWEAFEGNK